MVGSASTAVIGRTLYLAGGIVADTTTTRAAALDLDTWTWRDLPDMPRGRNHAAAATDGERLYIFGGRGAGSGDGNVVANGFDDVQIYDPATDSWTVSDGSPGAPPPLPQARGGMGKAVYLDGEFWILGGETLDGPGASELGTYGRVDIFDPTSSSWRSGPSLGVPRHGLFPVVHAGRIYVAGGGTQAGFSHSAVMEVIWPSPR
jgi:N-acetylneuraminic acid mutarotase